MGKLARFIEATGILSILFSKEKVRMYRKGNLLNKKLFGFVLLIALFFICLMMGSPMEAAAGWEIIQVTDSEQMLGWWNISGERLAWLELDSSSDWTDCRLSTWKIGDEAPIGLADVAFRPSIQNLSEDRVVWSCDGGAGGYLGDFGHWNIYSWTPEEGIVQITEGYNNLNPTVSGDRVVWRRYDNFSDWDIFSWTPEEGMIQITDIRYNFDNIYLEGKKWSPKVSGEMIAWHGEDANGHRQIYIYNPLLSRIQQITDREYYDGSHLISGDYITNYRLIWHGTDHIDGSGLLYTWTFLDGIREIAPSHHYTIPKALCGDRVVWSTFDDQETAQIYTWTPLDGVQQITDYEEEEPGIGPRRLLNPDVSGDRIVWTARDTNGIYQVFSWTFATGVQQITTSAIDKGNVKVSAERLSWSSPDDNDNVQLFMAKPYTVSTPDQPRGTDTGETGKSYLYSTGNSTCSCGSTVEYRFDWGDGTFSSWCTTGVYNKSWVIAGTYPVCAQARCTVHQTLLSLWSPALYVMITGDCQASTPQKPEGPTEGSTNSDLAYTTGGSYCSGGTDHELEYRFCWWEGANWVSTAWNLSGNAEITFAVPGTYEIYAQARCTVDPNSISPDSEKLVVNITGPPCKVSPPDPPAGRTICHVGTQYDYTTGGSSCACGAPVEYRLRYSSDNTNFAFTEWEPSGLVFRISYEETGAYLLYAEARCTYDHSESSYLSAALHVDVYAEACRVAEPDGPTGPTRGIINTPYTYITGGSDCSNGHDVVYGFDIYKQEGESVVYHDHTALNTSGSFDLTFSEAGTYYIFAYARCSVDDRTGVMNWEEFLEVNISAEPAPETSTYKFSYAIPTNIVEGEEIAITVTFGTVIEGDHGYENVRFAFAANGPGEVIFKATDSTGVEQEFINEGHWGPSEGFDLPADYNEYTLWRLVFDKAGTYTIIFSLIDAENENIISGITDSVSVEVVQLEIDPVLEVLWLSPASEGEVFVQRGAAPINLKFQLLDEGEVVAEEQDIDLRLENENDEVILTWGHGEGREALRFDEEYFEYTAQFRALDYDLVDGETYTAIIYDEFSNSWGQISFGYSLEIRGRGPQR